jgi:hypothetical protein
MKPPLRRHVSFANITSVMALMIALGGTSYAAIKIPKNSVGSAQIKKGGVAASDLRTDAVTATSVKNGSLQAADFASGQLPAGPRGATGAPGAPGAQGIRGIQGVPGVVGEITVQRTDVDLPNTGVAVAALASCPAGTKIIGGGATIADAGSKDIAMTVSRPYLTGVASGLPNDGQGFDSWRTVFVNPDVPGTPEGPDDTGLTTARSYAICAQT